MIALDIDGVLADTLTSLREQVALRFDLAPSAVVAASEWNNPVRVPGFPELQDAVNAYVIECWMGNEDVYRRAPAIEGALYMAASLEARNLLSGYVTRRHASLQAVTADWLSSRGFPQAPLIHAPGCKSVECIGIGARIIVEDAPHEIARLVAGGIHVIMPVRQYNRQLIGTPGVTSTYDLTRVPRIAEYLVGKGSAKA